MTTSTASTKNPLLVPWSGPYGGVPPFDRVSEAELEPALELAMREQLAEIEAIASDPRPPTFDNTIAALERSGRALDRATTLFNVLSSTRSTPEFQALETRMAPQLAEHADRITQNARLFARIAAVYEASGERDASALTSEQKRLAWLTFTSFVRAGAKLEPAAKARLSAINQRLASLFAGFAQSILGEESAYELVLEREEDCAGLPASVKAAAAAAASARGHQGKWSILNMRSSMEPFLTYADRRDLREKVWRTYYSRGDHGDVRDTKASIAEILRLRAERAQLLGYATHAHWRMEHSMAKTPERALALLESVWTPAVARVREEVADMQALAVREQAGITIEPWDYRYYAEKVRKEKFDLDQNALTPYLQLEKMREALFWVAGELFGLRFSPASGVPVLEPTVRVYEVLDARGKHVGLWYFDPYARQGKHSGAWMNAYRRQERFDGDVTTIVSNNTNFVPSEIGEPGAPILISWDDAVTMFHEFGHALHGLLSNVSYPTLSGTSVSNDYVEFPSQVLERWLETPQVLERFALHHKTGAPMPKELVERLRRASKFNQGFATVEYLAAALVDMRLHLAASATSSIDPATFERETLAALHMPRELVMRHRTTHFSHVFASDDYSAGYYAYLWADTLAADAWEAFLEAGSPWDAGVAQRLREHVFSVGNTIDPALGYRAFRGRDPDTAALMRKRGFPVA